MASSMSPIAAGVFNLLNVAAMTALVGTRIYDDVPRVPVYPFVWIETLAPRDARGFGTGGMPEVLIRVHAFSTYQGEKEAQRIIGKAVDLLRDQAITATGYEQAGLVFNDEPDIPLQDQAIEGVKVQERVALFRTYMKEL